MAEPGKATAREIVVARRLPARRHDEPEDDELLAMIEGRLSPLATAELRARLRRFPFSAARVQILREALVEQGFLR